MFPTYSRCRYRRQQVLSSLHASTLRPSVRPKRIYHSNSVTVLHIGLKFNGIVDSTISQIAVLYSHTWPNFARHWTFSMIGLDQDGGLCRVICWHCHGILGSLKWLIPLWNIIHLTAFRVFCTAVHWWSESTVLHPVTKHMSRCKIPVAPFTNMV